MSNERVGKKKANKGAGRPYGGTKRNGAARDNDMGHFRASDGFKKVVDMLIEAGHYKSRSDVYHDALQQLALRKHTDIEHYDFWVKKIQ